jgi:hypothetical protein
VITIIKLYIQPWQYAFFRQPIQIERENELRLPNGTTQIFLDMGPCHDLDTQTVAFFEIFMKKY